MEHNFYGAPNGVRPLGLYVCHPTTTKLIATLHRQFPDVPIEIEFEDTKLSADDIKLVNRALEWFESATA